MNHHILKLLPAIRIAWLAMIPCTAMAAPGPTIPARWITDKANEWFPLRTMDVPMKPVSEDGRAHNYRLIDEFGV